MNDILSLPRVVEIMAETANIDPSSSERFIKAFFSHLEDALAVSESVKIDGLGVFLRTNDPVTPIKFIPDQELTEAVNQPFDMFEPIAVGDTDLSSDIEIQPAQTKSVTPPAISEQVQTVADEAPYIEPVAQQVNTQADKTNEPNAEDSNVTVADEIEYPGQPFVMEEKRPKSHTATWICIAFLLGLVIGAIITFLSHDRLQTIFAPEDNDASAIVTADNEDDMDDEILCEVVGNTVKIYEMTSEDKTNQPTVRPEVYDTVTPNRFLTTMARQYYGPMEYWVFIYEANADHLGNPNRIKPGTRVLIPDRTDFETDGSTEETINRAKKIGREIYARFE